MRFVIQNVSHAEVKVDEKVTGSIDQGFLVLIGVSDTDDEKIADRMVAKMLKLRIFEDENGKTNLDLKTVGGSLLLISQFTLYADCRKGNRPSFVKGNRPSFVKAGAPDHAQALYEYIIRKCKESVPNVQQGIFGAYMHVSLTNEGPFTVIMDSKELGYEA